MFFGLFHAAGGFPRTGCQKEHLILHADMRRKWPAKRQVKSSFITREEEEPGHWRLHGLSHPSRWLTQRIRKDPKPEAKWVEKRKTTTSNYCLVIITRKMCEFWLFGQHLPIRSVSVSLPYSSYSCTSCSRTWYIFISDLALGHDDLIRLRYNYNSKEEHKGKKPGPREREGSKKLLKIRANDWLSSGLKKLGQASRPFRGGGQRTIAAFVVLPARW